MISGITGRLLDVGDTRARISVGAFVCDVLFPAADRDALSALKGQDVSLHTMMYLEGDATRGNLEPRLLGFRAVEDREFFELFITVKGIGPRKALRAIAVAIGDIARAIESRDTATLVKLPEIGKRTAETIVAELCGKMARFVSGPAVRGQAARRFTAAEEDAIMGLVALGEKRADAEGLLQRVKDAGTPLPTADAMLREMLRLRTASPR